METFSATKYGIRRIGQDVRYVGITTQNLDLRLRQHINASRSYEDSRKFYEWLRVNSGEVEIIELGTIVGTYEDIRQAETDLIKDLIEKIGSEALNSDTISSWFPGAPRDKESRARYSASKTGEKNPMFGIRGESHPSFGRVVSEGTRLKMSEAKRGERHPNFGKKMSEETRRKISESKVGKTKPQPSGPKYQESARRGAHTRHHVNKGVRNPDCKFCIE